MQWGYYMARNAADDVVLGQRSDLVRGITVELVHYQTATYSAEWYNFYIRAPGARKRHPRKYHGAWNRQRISGTGDMKIIQSKYPQVYDWALNVLREHFGD